MTTGTVQPPARQDTGENQRTPQFTPGPALSQSPPPHSILAEQRICGCLVSDPITVFQALVEAGVTQKHFYEMRYQNVWHVIATAWEAGARDNGAFAVALAKAPADSFGGLSGINELMLGVSGAAEYKSWLPDLIRAYQQRALTRTAALLADCVGGSGDLVELAGLAAASLAAFATRHTPKKLSFRSPGEILAMEFDGSDRILGDRLLAKGQSLVIAGPPGCRKSRLALQLAAQTIAGEAWLGFETRGEGQRWLIIQTENNCQRLQSDLRELKAHLGDRFDAVNESLLIHTLEGDHDYLMALADPKARRKLEAIVEEFDPAVIAWDVLRDFALGSDLNCDSDMASVCADLSALSRRGNPERAFVILHHSLAGRSGLSKAVGWDRGAYARGSKVLLGWARAVINVAPAASDSTDGLIIACGKCSNGREFKTFCARIGSDGIYRPDPNFSIKEWERDVAGERSAARSGVTAERIAALAGPGEHTKAELADIIMADCGLSRSTAFRKIDMALAARKLVTLKLNGKLTTPYRIPSPKTESHEIPMRLE